MKAWRVEIGAKRVHTTVFVSAESKACALFRAREIDPGRVISIKEIKP